MEHILKEVLSKLKPSLKEEKELSILSQKILALIAKQKKKATLEGSTAKGTYKEESDIDILFIIPDAYPYAAFEKKIKHALTISPLDIQITTEKGLLEMWQHPLQLNVGNEILKKHILLRGAEAFFLLRKKHYWG